VAFFKKQPVYKSVQVVENIKLSILSFLLGNA
jgi:hypothetical protein